jgi:hypothetical protein
MGDNCINQFAINELVEHSKNVEEYEERAIKLCEWIAKRRIAGKEDKEINSKLWRNEGKKLHNDYVLYFDFKQPYVTEHLNDATYDKLGEDLAEAYKNC